MKCQADIEILALSKLVDAECLSDNGRADGAYYLAGYCIELLLKARVCKTLGIPDFFNFGSSTKKKLKNEGNLAKPYKVHDFEQLLVLSGIYNDFEQELTNDPLFKAHWSVVSKWNEDCRYLTGQNPQDVKDFLTSVKEIAQWIQKHL